MPTALSDLEIADTRRQTSKNQTQTDRFAGAAESARIQDTSQLQLTAALQQNVNLLRLCSLLSEKVSSLASELANANQLAYYDELTGLPNRRLLVDRFTQAAALASRHRQILAVLFFDVDDFKKINDELGHSTGDKLLRQIAARLSGSIRKSDTVCRYGGDEFVGLLTNIDHRKDAVRAVQEIRAELSSPYEIDRSSIRLTVSNGLAIYPRDARGFTDLIQLADRSMLGNKSRSRGRSGDISNRESRYAIWERNSAQTGKGRLS